MANQIEKGIKSIRKEIDKVLDRLEKFMVELSKKGPSKPEKKSVSQKPPAKKAAASKKKAAPAKKKVIEKSDSLKD